MLLRNGNNPLAHMMMSKYIVYRVPIGTRQVAGVHSKILLCNLRIIYTQQHCFTTNKCYMRRWHTLLLEHTTILSHFVWLNNVHTSISHVASPGLGYGVKLVKEQHTWSGGTGLVKHVSHVGLRLAKPHSQQFWALESSERRGERQISVTISHHYDLIIK